MSDYDFSDSEPSEVDYSSDEKLSESENDEIFNNSDQEDEKKSKSMLALSSESESEDLEDSSSDEEKKEKPKKRVKKSEEETKKVTSKLKELRKQFLKRQKRMLKERSQLLKSSKELTMEDDPRIIYLKEYVLKGFIQESNRDKIYNLWNKFMLNKSRYLELNTIFKTNPKFTNKKVSEEEVEFFNSLIKLYEKPAKIIDTVNNYIKYKQQEASKIINKDIGISDINSIIKKFKADVRDKNELTEAQRDLLNLVEISFKRTVNDNSKVNEFSILNFYLRALKYLLINNRVSITQMIKLGQIEETFGNLLLSIEPEDVEKLNNVKVVLKYIVDNNENQLKIVSILNTMKKGVSEDNVVGVLVINNYIKAIIATGLKDTTTIQTYMNEGKIDNEYGKYLLDIIRGNVVKNVPELYEELISNFSNKKTTKFVRDPLSSNLVRRKLRIINDEDTRLDKDIVKLPQYLKKCISTHILREWNINKYSHDFIHFIGHPRLLTKDEMKTATSKDISNIKYYGNELATIDISKNVKGQNYLPIYEPSIEFWKLHCTVNHGENDAAKCNYRNLLLTLSDKYGVREFYNGLYNPKTKQYVIFDEKDYEEECNYFAQLNKTDEMRLMDFYNFILIERQSGKLRKRIIDLFEKIFISEENLDVSRKNALERAEDLESVIYKSFNDEDRTIYNYLSKVADISILFDKTKVVYNLADYSRYLLYVVRSSEFPYITSMSYEQKLPVLRFINEVDRNNIISLIGLLKEEIITDQAKNLYAFQHGTFLKVNTKPSIKDNQLLDKILNINNYKSLQQNLIELCEESSNVNRVFLLGKNNEIYCATPANYSKYLSMDNVEDKDKDLIEDLFGNSSRLYKERKLLYIYLAQQYLANEKNKEPIQRSINEYESNLIDIFGEVIEDDYELIQDVYQFIEERQKVKLNDKEKVEIFNYVRSTINDYSDMTQDIITLLTSKQDEYTQKYVKDYKKRLEKYSDYDEKTELFKSLVERDIEGRTEIFEDVLMVLSEKYKNKYVEFEKLDLASPFVAYLVQYMSEILDSIIKKENEEFVYTSVENIELCYKCGKQSIPYTTTFLHEPSELVDEANENIELMNKQAYVCSQDCLAKLQETIKEEKQLKDDLIRSCINTISEVPKDKDIVLRIAKELNIPDYEQFSIEELWDISKLNISWVPNFNNVKTLHCMRELCKLFRVKFDENKLVVTWRKLIDNKKFYNEFISRIDVEKYKNILKTIDSIYKEKIKLNDNYFSVDCNILEKDMETFLSQYGNQMYGLFVKNVEVKEEDIIYFFNEFQDKFKCAVKESVMNKYRQYTRTVKLIYNYLLAINRLMGTGKELNFSNIKYKMKDIQKGSKSIDTDINYMIESINNITKNDYTFNELTKNIVSKIRNMSAMDEKSKINRALKYILPSTVIQLDFDEIMNVYEIYKKVGFRLMKYIRSQFSYNKDFKVKKEMETLLSSLQTDKLPKKVIRPGMRKEEIEKIKEERLEAPKETEKVKRKLKLLQPKREETKEQNEVQIGKVVEIVKTASTQVSEEEQMYINFDKFMARIQTFIDNYIRYKLEIKVKKEDTYKPSSRRLYYERELEEGDEEEIEESKEMVEVMEEKEVKLEPTAIKFGDVVNEVSKITEEKGKEEIKDIFVTEEPKLIFTSDEVKEEEDFDIEGLAADLEQAISNEEEIDII